MAITHSKTNNFFFLGPTAIIALLIQRYVRDNADFAVFIAFINGALIFLFGLLNLGFLVQFISIPVLSEHFNDIQIKLILIDFFIENFIEFCFYFIWKVTVGFTSAAALTIGSSQIKSLLGLKGSTNEFIPTWINLWKHVSETRLWDTVLGVFTICLLLLLKVSRFNVTAFLLWLLWFSFIYFFSYFFL